MYSANSPKPQTTKLRASCDTCFVAKVRCSKSRPMCSRCLAFGAECKYSPSSRAGKPKSDKGSRHAMPKNDFMSEDSTVCNSNKYSSPSVLIDTEEPTSYFLETDWWITTSPPVDGQQNREFMSPAMMPMMGDQSPSEASSRGSADPSDHFVFWSPTPPTPTEVMSPYMDNVADIQHENMTEASVSPSASFWSGQSDNVQFQTSGTCDPQLGRIPNVFMDECMTQTTTCGCFKSCLQVLQTLHNFNALPPASSVDIVLTVNQKAMETCSATLNCPLCNAKSGNGLRTTLLGTILGRIILIYQDTSRNYFGPLSEPGSDQSPALTYGMYRVASEDISWLQLVIILRDLKKYKALLTKFQETTVQSNSEGDIEMHAAIMTHLYQSLHLTCEALKKHKTFAWGQVD